MLPSTNFSVLQSYGLWFFVNNYSRKQNSANKAKSLPATDTKPFFFLSTVDKLDYSKF